jgi:hypothetical protein
MTPNLTDLILLFKQLVAKDFDFLLQDYAFRLVHEEEYSSGIQFRYESPKVAVEMSFIRHELGLQIGVKDSEEKDGLSVSIGDLVILANHEPFHDLVFSVEGMESWLGEMAEVLKSHDKPFLIGDTKAYQKIAESRSSRVESYMLETQLCSVRKKLNQAWEAKDYTSVVAILKPVKNYLSLAELKKLEYAQKHIRS